VHGARHRRSLLIFQPEFGGALEWQVRPLADATLDGQLGSEFHDKGSVNEDRHTTPPLLDRFDTADCPFNWFGSFTHVG
jgi:hypothetical protein